MGCHPGKLYITCTFTLRAFGRRFYPRRLTKSTFVEGDTILSGSTWEGNAFILYIHQGFYSKTIKLNCFLISILLDRSEWIRRRPGCRRSDVPAGGSGGLQPGRAGLRRRWRPLRRDPGAGLGHGWSRPDGGLHRRSSTRSGAVF